MKHRFNEAQTRLLEANPNVKHASDRSISYEPEFKLRAVQIIFCRTQDILDHHVLGGVLYVAPHDLWTKYMVAQIHE